MGGWNFQDLTGQRFSKLTVIERVKSHKLNDKHAYWKCLCDCGNYCIVASHHLRSGETKSCGCLNNGKSYTRLYRIWNDMKCRCYRNKETAYKYYGDRGIIVCDEWVNDFQAFYVWAMANGYRDDLTIDRIDNNKGYSPDNCRWATYKTQENNRTNNMIVEYKGQKYTVSQLSKILGISQPTLNWRIKHNWAENKLDIPVNLNNSNIRRLKNGTK